MENERYYTFLTPLEFEHKGKEYFVYGYVHNSLRIICFSATSARSEKWTDSVCYDNKELLEAFAHLVPPIEVKRKRKSTK